MQFILKDQSTLIRTKHSCKTLLRLFGINVLQSLVVPTLELVQPYYIQGGRGHYAHRIDLSPHIFVAFRRSWQGCLRHIAQEATTPPNDPTIGGVIITKQLTLFQLGEGGGRICPPRFFIFRRPCLGGLRHIAQEATTPPNDPTIGGVIITKPVIVIPSSSKTQKSIFFLCHVSSQFYDDLKMEPKSFLTSHLNFCSPRFHQIFSYISIHNQIGKGQ